MKNSKEAYLADAEELSQSSFTYIETHALIIPNPGPYIPGTTLECLSLIQYHVLPLDPLEILYVLHHQLVAGDHHMEGCILSVEGLLQIQKGRSQKRLLTIHNGVMRFRLFFVKSKC